MPRGPPSPAHRDAVDHRHDQATGVPHEGSAHHFLLTPDGGEIRLESTDGSDGSTPRAASVRTCGPSPLAFAAGDFAMPRRIHDRAPDGADVMTERRDAIRYAFHPTERGGRVTIATEDPAARRAVHAFLRFQIHRPRYGRSGRVASGRAAPAARHPPAQLRLSPDWPASASIR